MKRKLCRLSKYMSFKVYLCFSSNIFRHDRCGFRRQYLKQHLTSLPNVEWSKSSVGYCTCFEESNIPLNLISDTEMKLITIVNNTPVLFEFVFLILTIHLEPKITSTKIDKYQLKLK